VLSLYSLLPYWIRYALVGPIGKSSASFHINVGLARPHKGRSAGEEVGLGIAHRELVAVVVDVFVLALTSAVAMWLRWTLAEQANEAV